ncbi:MAG: hypothetical protein QME78_04465, partial [Thermodesulfobacteriota bacterium]|nr:hypothetical protein [Thermodesulfobacteriota bacterium]
MADMSSSPMHSCSGLIIFPKRIDVFLKSPSAALRRILRLCGVPLSTPHSSGFARLAYGAFYFAIPILTFYEI